MGSITFNGKAVYMPGEWGNDVPAVGLEVKLQLQKTELEEVCTGHVLGFPVYETQSVDSWEDKASGTTDGDGSFSLNLGRPDFVPTGIRVIIVVDGREIEWPRPDHILEDIIDFFARAGTFRIDFPRLMFDFPPPLVALEVAGTVVDKAGTAANRARVDIKYLATSIWGDNTDEHGHFDAPAKQKCLSVGALTPTVNYGGHLYVLPPKPFKPGDRRIDFGNLVLKDQYKVPDWLGPVIGVVTRFLSTDLTVKGRVEYPALPGMTAAPVGQAGVEILLDGTKSVWKGNAHDDGTFETTISDCLPGGAVLVRSTDEQNPFPPVVKPYVGLPSNTAGGLACTVEFSRLVVLLPLPNVGDLLSNGIPVHMTLTGAQDGPIQANVGATLGGTLGADVNANAILGGRVGADVNANATLGGRVGADVNANATLGGSLNAKVKADALATLAGDDQHPLRMELNLSRLPKGKLKLNGFDIGFYLFSWRIFSIKMKGEAGLEDND